MNEKPAVLYRFLDHTYMNKSKSMHTINSYRYDLVEFLKYIKWSKTSDEAISDYNAILHIKSINIEDIDNAFFEDISIDDVDNYLIYLYKYKSNQSKSRARKISTIKSFFKYLYNKKIIKNNNMISLETPHISKSLPVYLSLQEAEKYINTIKTECLKERYKERNLTMIILFLNTGIRISELVGLNINSITKDLLNYDILIVRGKGDKERVVYLNSNTMAALNNYLKIRTNINCKDTALFLSERNERISTRTVSHIVKHYSEECKIDKKITPHKFRHTLATSLFQNGTDIRTIQFILGHSSISTTEIYTHVSDAQARSALSNNPLSNI